MKPSSSNPSTQQSQVNTTSFSQQTVQKQMPTANFNNQLIQAQNQNVIKQDSKFGSSFLLSPIKDIDNNQQELKIPSSLGQLNFPQIEKQINKNFPNEIEDDDDIEPLIFDIEEIEFRMNNINEMSKSEEGLLTRSIRGSIIHTPKDFPLITPSSKINDSYLNQSSLEVLDFQQYKNFQDFLKYDTDRNLDISMTSVCTSPRQINMDVMNDSNNEIQSPSQYVLKYYNQQFDRKIDEEGSINQKALDMNMSPKLHEHNSLSSQRLNDSYSLNYSNNVSKQNRAFSTSERSNAQFRSSAEVSEIEKEVNKHKRYQNSLSSYEKHMDPEAQKRNLQISMQLQLQSLVNKINEKEKLYLAQEKIYNELMQQSQKIDTKAIKIEQKLKKENNLNLNLRTQLNFLLQSQFNLSYRHNKYQKAKSNPKKITQE